MFKVRMDPWLMILINFGISILLFSFFQSIGWFEVTGVWPLWAVVLVVSLLNVITGLLVGFLLLAATPLVAIIAFCTLGLGLILLGPVVSYLTLYLSAVITQLFSMSTIWWQALIIGAAFGWLRLSLKTSD